MKRCPVCKAGAFDDAEVCYGCLFRFEAPALTAMQQKEDDLASSMGDTAPLPPLSDVGGGDASKSASENYDAFEAAAKRYGAFEARAEKQVLSEAAEEKTVQDAKDEKGTADTAEGKSASEAASVKERRKKCLMKGSSERRGPAEVRGSLPAAVLSGLAAGGFEDLPSEAWAAPSLLETVEVPGFLLAKSMQVPAGRPIGFSVSDAPHSETRHGKGSFPRSCACLRQGYSPQAVSSASHGHNDDLPGSGGNAVAMPEGKQGLEMLLPAAFAPQHQADELLISR